MADIGQPYLSKETTADTTADFTICTPYSDRECLELRKLVEAQRNFAAYFPISLINELCKDVTGGGY